MISCLCRKRVDQKDKFYFKFYEVTIWLKNNFNTLLIVLKSKGNQAMQFV